MQLEILSCSGYGTKSFNLWGFDAQCKITFDQLALLSNDPILMPYLSGIYLRMEFGWNFLMVFLVMGRVEENRKNQKSEKSRERKRKNTGKVK